MMGFEIALEDRKIIIKFNSLVDAIDIIRVLYYYINDESCILIKILLVSHKNNTKWYNDITTNKVIGLFDILFKLKGVGSEKTSAESTHITESVLNSESAIEIYTLNSKNSMPLLLSREEILKILYGEWLKLL